MANEINNEQLQALLNGKKKQNVDKDAADLEITKVLTFFIGEQIYGIEIPNVIEIIEVPPITAVPGVPEYIKGIINVRSKVIPVVNIRSRFGKEEIEFTDRTCIIIVATGDITVGLIVDCVSDVIPIAERHIAKTPNLGNVNNEKFIKFIVETEEGIRLVLDVPKLIDEQPDESSKG